MVDLNFGKNSNNLLCVFQRRGLSLQYAAPGFSQSKISRLSEVPLRKHSMTAKKFLSHGLKTGIG